MSAPTSSFEMDALAGKSVPIAADTILLKDSAASNELKEITFSNLQVAILSDGSIVTLTGVQTLENKTLLIPVIADFTNATHDHLDDAGGSVLTAAAISDIQNAITNNTEVLANTAKVTNANHTGDVTGATVLSIAVDAVDIENLSATGTPDGTTFLRGDNTWAVPPGSGGASAPFTWASSDEDSPLDEALLYTTEATASEITISEVVLSLKNAPTGGKITVDIKKETGPNTNVFATIFSTLPTIDINEFTSQTAAIAAVISDSTWEVERRLQIFLTITDTNFAATGLKVTLA